MDPSTLAAVLWGGFFVAVVLGAVGIRCSPDRSGIALAPAPFLVPLFCAVAYAIAFAETGPAAAAD